MPSSIIKLAIFASLTSRIAFASAISLSLVESGKNKYYELETDKLKNLSASVLHPDNAYKLEGKQIWAGPTFATLTSKFKDQLSNYPNTIIIGSDTYLVKLPTNDLLLKKSVFATKKNDKAIAKNKGGIHTIFTPSSDKRYHEDSSFWVWSVQGITLGELVPTIRIKSNKTDIKTIDTNKLKKIYLENYKFTYPPGRRIEDEIPKKINKVQGIELNDLIETKGITELEISNSFGKIASRRDEIKNLVAVVSIDNQPISRSLGGPIQICDRNNSKKCLYFADLIEVSKR